MNKQKQLWEKLAKENSRYYINSDRGKKITESEFRRSGEEDYEKYILSDELLDFFSFKDDVLLEIGCGTGRMTEFMAKDFKKVIGIDISGEMIKQARARLNNFENVALLENDGERLSLPDNSIDLAFSYLVFQHMKTKETVEKNFREVYRVLKPIGLFKVRLRIDKVTMNKWWAGVNYSEEEAKMLAYKIGFGVSDSEPVGDYGLWLWLTK